MLCKKKQEESDTSFNPNPIIDRDSNAVQVNNLTTDRGISVAYDELQSTMFQYPRNSCQANDVEDERRNCQENDLKSNSRSELSSRVFATQNVVKTFFSNKAESHIGAPMTSLAETCGTESDTCVKNSKSSVYKIMEKLLASQTAGITTRYKLRKR